MSDDKNYLEIAGHRIPVVTDDTLPEGRVRVIPLSPSAARYLAWIKQMEERVWAAGMVPPSVMRPTHGEEPALSQGITGREPGEVKRPD